MGDSVCPTLLYGDNVKVISIFLALLRALQYNPAINVSIINHFKVFYRCFLQCYFIRAIRFDVKIITLSITSVYCIKLSFFIILNQSCTLL